MSPHLAIIRIQSQLKQASPLISNPELNEWIGGKVWFKCENLQPSGSFKIRGAFNHLLRLIDDGHLDGVCTHSSGNHGAAVAFVARNLDLKCVVVVPRNSSAIKVKSMENMGAEIVFCDPDIASRQETLNKVIDETGYIPVHPYDHEYTIEGQSTCAWEIFQSLSSQPPHNIILPVGGGGLAAGSVLTRDARGMDTAIYAAEPERSGDAFNSWKSGKHQTGTEGETMADGLRAPLGSLNFTMIKDGVEAVIPVPEEHILPAMRWMWTNLKILSEPSSAVAFAALMHHPEKFRDQDTVVVITGGNADPSLWQQISETRAPDEWPGLA